MVFSARETSPSEWRAGLAEAASIGDSYADAASVEASGLKTVFERRVRLTVLRATGLAQVQVAPELSFFRTTFVTPIERPPQLLLGGLISYSGHGHYNVGICRSVRLVPRAVPHAKYCTDHNGMGPRR